MLVVARIVSSIVIMTGTRSLNDSNVTRKAIVNVLVTGFLEEKIT